MSPAAQSSMVPLNPRGELLRALFLCTLHIVLSYTLVSGEAVDAAVL